MVLSLAMVRGHGWRIALEGWKNVLEKSNGRKEVRECIQHANSLCSNSLSW